MLPEIYKMLLVRVNFVCSDIFTLVAMLACRPSVISMSQVLTTILAKPRILRITLIQKFVW